MRNGITFLGRLIAAGAVVGALALLVTFSWAAEPENGGKNAASTRCASDLARRLKLPESEIEEIDAVPVDWPDASLGMPEAGKLYAQMIVPGYRVILGAKNSRYLYAASETALKYGGPVALWSSSLLYTRPLRNEPNLNGELYQCSMLGTNSVLLASGVSEYYPQANGTVIFTRRTSRSGQDLLHVSPEAPGRPRTLRSGFAFGPAAMNDSGDRTAVFMRSAVGSPWVVAVFSPSAGRSGREIPTPEGIQPVDIAWSGEKLMILVSRGEDTLCYSTLPEADKAAWLDTAPMFFPSEDYMLNKSETLEITEVSDAGAPAVEVARVWFTGKRNVIARIPDLKLLRYDFLAGRYAVVFGEKPTGPTACTVDIATGETIPGVCRGAQSIKLLRHAPPSSPLRGR